MEMVRMTLIMIVCSAGLGASEFSLTVGNPLAAHIPRMKAAALAVRLDHCADLSKASLTGTVEGLAAGERKSEPLQIVPSTTAPGVYGVGHGRALEGAWVANLKATCGDAKAGAIVPFRGTNFLRESLKVFPRFATAAEVDGSLKGLSGGTK